MKVKVVSITQSLIEEAHLNAEELLVYVARASNPSNQLNTSTSDKLLRYLIKNKHWSPFDMADLCVEVKTSRAIAQQILRHWSFDFQEFSQRYAEVVDIEPLQIRQEGSSTRQGSVEGDYDPDISEKYRDGKYTGQKLSVVMDKYIQIGQQLYREALDLGVAKESARMILPLTTQTTIYMKGSVRSWMFYLSQRLDAHAQLEHRQVAQEIYKIFSLYFPNVCKAFFEDGE